MKSNGVPAEEIQRIISEYSEKAEALCLVEDAELQAVRLFSRVQSQWRRNDMTGLPEGLDYGGVRAVAEILGIELNEAVFECIQVMEIAAIGAWIERDRRSRP